MNDKQPFLEKPAPGSGCQNCGHYANRHTEEANGSCIGMGQSCNCASLRVNGIDWPRPWMDAPNGLVLDDRFLLTERPMSMGRLITSVEGQRAIQFVENGHHWTGFRTHPAFPLDVAQWVWACYDNCCEDVPGSVCLLCDECYDETEDLIEPCPKDPGNIENIEWCPNHDVGEAVGKWEVDLTATPVGHGQCKEWQLYGECECQERCTARKLCDECHTKLIKVLDPYGSTEDEEKHNGE